MFLIEQSVRRELAWRWHDMCGRLGFHKLHKLQKHGACPVLQAAFGILSGCPLVTLVPPLKGAACGWPVNAGRFSL